MPSYGGVDIFGRAVRMTPKKMERAVQKNEFFGLDGVEELDGGSRGRETLVTGLIVAADAAAFQAIIAVWEGLQDGVARDLVTTVYGTYPEAKLRSFSPKPGTKRDPYYGICVEYEAVFFHLI